MDHIWDGFYTGQTRLSRFPLQVENDKDYTIEYTGTPPGKQRFELKSGIEGTGIFIRLRYAEAGAYEVKIGNTVKAPTAWNTDIGKNAPLTKKAGCGEFRWVGIKNFMEFFITPGCEVTIVPKKAVIANVRMEWTLTEFYADGGTSKFADRIASALGIHSSRIKVVAVYEGSVVVNYHIEAEETASETAQIAQVTQLTTTLASVFTSGTGASILGAPILSSNVGTDGVDLIAASVATTTTSTSSDALAVDTTPVGVGETMRAAVTAFAPMLYALNKNPEVMDRLVEIANTQFLGDDDGESTGDSEADEKEKEKIKAAEEMFDDDVVVK